MASTIERQDTEALAKTAQAMYNRHPFPRNYSIPPSRADERFRRIQQEFLGISLAQLSGKTFLDAGCGTGENTWFWRRSLPPDARLIAVDLSYASIAIARSCGRDQPLQPEFTTVSLLDIALPSACADVIYCSGVLHHIPDPDRALDELVRVLKPGGYLVLVLYHRYGRLIHRLRRTAVTLLAGNDVDRRARMGGRLFGRSMRSLAAKEQVPLEGILYDQFGLPCEYPYSVGQVLNSFRTRGIAYVGSWPPVEWQRFGRVLRFSHRFRERRPGLFGLLLRLFPDVDYVPVRAPSWLTRVSMQVLWTLDQQQLFAISGRKAAPGASDHRPA